MKIESRWRPLYTVGLQPQARLAEANTDKERHVVLTNRWLEPANLRVSRIRTVFNEVFVEVKRHAK